MPEQMRLTSAWLLGNQARLQNGIHVRVETSPGHCSNGLLFRGRSHRFGYAVYLAHNHIKFNGGRPDCGIPAPFKHCWYLGAVSYVANDIEGILHDNGFTVWVQKASGCPLEEP